MDASLVHLLPGWSVDIHQVIFLFFFYGWFGPLIDWLILFIDLLIYLNWPRTGMVDYFD